MRGGRDIGTDGEVVPGHSPPQIVEHNTRLDPRRPGGRIDLDDSIQERRTVEHHRGVHGLSGETRPGTAGKHRNAFVSAPGDGLDDIVVPTLSGVELWLASLGTEQRAPAFRKMATISVEVAHWGSHDAEYLSDSLESSFAIPGLATRDVNGDGRPDLLVEQGNRRAFHLQREDGSFPLEADVAVDLSIFRDTTEASGFALGGTLSAGDKASW